MQNVTRAWDKSFEATIHVDGSARVHTVDKDTKYIEEPVYQSCDISIHQQMYDFCTRMINRIGGSENRY